MLTVTTPGVPEEAGPRVSLLVYHRDGSQLVPLGAGRPSSVVVGRARPADVPVRDPSLSRQHARFELVQGELWVEDLGSTNGTRVNGKKIKRTRVKESDEVQLGSVTVAFHVLGSALEPDEPGLQGMDSHDGFMARLEQELVRARTFSRPITLLMVGAAKRKNGHVSRWGPRVRALLRSVDPVALYDQSTVLIGLVESGEAEAGALTQAILEGKQKSEPELRCGMAIFPDHGATAEELVEAVRGALRRTTGRQRLQLAEGSQAPEVAEGTPVVISPRMHEIHETARRVADSMLPVLIYGETGTGKEVLARTIHESSKRKKKPLRCINCASIPENLVESALFGHERGAFTSADARRAGIFEEADGGTVLLDEVGELSQAAQAALLRVIET